ncbi:MAG: imidazoleglycerol-phosphate dehydratase HisB [Candidatus Xiphinematobacter sp.]|nr:MAG: imidazoleglycerol-phosphate dehydratase HisB [Candidatus Xiphinematobacter sp.]QQY09639.1 MAG: imidazoleglycerol-phosphate dehydratase HisB [Candidatus Xiphinematobacter sp.]QQY11125.1 MAG: imidazoleglycerol-phosphate dehydratase HisB [Candidatus Xiphinematobacter sp.]
MSRIAKIERSTRETQLRLVLDVDGGGNQGIATGIPFFDHMLDLFAFHGLFGLEIVAEGDIAVDLHHTVEDIGITLGAAFAQALGSKSGLVRYGCSYIPMDEALVRSVVDISGRSLLVYHAPLEVEGIGSFSFQLVEEFLRAFSTHAALTLHVEVLCGRNSHHMAEGIFKSLARALSAATSLNPDMLGIPSTKGLV